jgi:hypothetical protein
MSGTTVISNALQFTNDNKHAYAFSGIVDVNNSETQLLLLNTQSEYLLSKLTVLQGTTSNEDFLYKVFFNDIAVAQWHCLQVTTINTNMPNVYDFVIPPFTVVKVTAQNTSSATNRDHSATLTAKVGMPQRVGNLNE